MKKTVNLFVIHTVFQRYVAERIIDKKLSLKGQNIALVNEEESVSVDLNDFWDDKVILTPSIGNTWKGLTPIHSKIVVKKIIDSFREYEIVNIFMANVNYPLSNTLFKYVDGKRINFVQYPEGFANIVIQRMTFNIVLKLISKFFYGLLQLNPFKFYGADYGASKYAKHIINLDEIIGHQEKINSSTDSRALIVGQFADYDINYLNDYVKALKGVVKKFDKHKVYYKPHPREKKDVLDIISKLKGLKIISSNQPIEEFYLENFFPNLIGFSSTSLLTIKKIFNKEVSVYSIHPSIIDGKKTKRRTEVHEYLKKHGVKGLTIN